MTIEAPHWDLSNVYPGLESTEYKSAMNLLVERIRLIEKILDTQISVTNQLTPTDALSNLVGETVDLFNQTEDLSDTLGAYIYSFVSTDSHDDLARRQLSEFEQITIKLQDCAIQFRAWLGVLEPLLDDIAAANQTAHQHEFFLRENAEQAKYLMSNSEESLAAELSLSGANAWEKLQGTITSQLYVDFELDGEIQRLPLPAIINLHSHPDEALRRRAYDAELQALDSMREPLAACMNGVKGAVVVLNRRRGRSDALHSALDRARIDRQTLATMLEAMESSFPAFRTYFKTKAKRLGKDKLAWWDLYAPIGQEQRIYTFDEARSFILDNFAGFTPHLAEFAKNAFDHNWIDAKQRDGKRGGAFCMDLPAVKESRILSNFDGSLDQVTTIAHELGHGYHNLCAFQAGKTSLQRRTPMTLAETASILCETIVMQAAMKEAQTQTEELTILETMLIGHSQVIVDIFSRYLFEKEVFERRSEAELSAHDYCEMMENAQIATYGEGLDYAFLNRYMWAWKPHYYSEGLSFYNFPYAFGLLFGLGLYAIFQQHGAAFVPEYQKLLASTGEASPADLAANFGINIQERDFWDNSLNVIRGNIQRYTMLN